MVDRYETMMSISILPIIVNPYLRYVILFTIFQALLSSLLTILLAIPIARALHRQPNLLGRKFLLKCFSLAFTVPSIAIIFGLITIYGKAGWFNWVLTYSGIDNRFHIYGLSGVLLAHLFFNLPYASQIFLRKLENIPDQTWKLASQLALPGSVIFRYIEWPLLKEVILGLGAIVFLVCFTSFVVVLSLGGGPAVTSIEVVIYQALKFDFDLTKALGLALIQFMICLGVSLTKLQYSNVYFSHDLVHPSSERLDGLGWKNKLVDILALSIAVLLIILPLFAVLVAGLNYRLILVLQEPALWSAIKTSLIIAMASGCLSLCLAAVLLIGGFYLKYHKDSSKLADALLMFSKINLLVSPFVIATLLFILLHLVLGFDRITGYVIIITNSLMALPFVIGILQPCVMFINKEEWWLCQNLNIKGTDFFKVIMWPKLRRATSFAFSIAVMLSWGDLSVIALFGRQDLSTLPILLYQKMENYRVDDSGVIALIMLILALTIFFLVDKIFRVKNVNHRSFTI